MGNSLIAQYLIDDKLLTPKETSHIARDTLNNGASFIKIILGLGLFTEESLIDYYKKRAKSAAHPPTPWSYPDAFRDDYPLELFAHLEVLPEKIEGENLHVIMPDPLDQGTIEQLRFFTNKQVIGKIAPMTYILKSLSLESEDFSITPVTILPNLLKTLLRNPKTYKKFSHKQLTEGLRSNPFLSVYIPDNAKQENIAPWEQSQIDNPTELLSGKTGPFSGDLKPPPQIDLSLLRKKRTLTSFMGKKIGARAQEHQQNLAQLSEALSEIPFTTKKEDALEKASKCFELIAISQFYYIRIKEDQAKVLYKWPEFSRGLQKIPNLAQEIAQLAHKKAINQWFEIPQKKQKFLNWPDRKGYVVLGLKWDYLLHTNYCFIQWKSSSLEKEASDYVKQLLKSLSIYG